jgi:hypothetical protein
LTETAAAAVPGMLVQAKAGHAHGSTTGRYLHAAKTSYPDTAEIAEARLFATPFLGGGRGRAASHGLKQRAEDEEQARRGPALRPCG